MEAARENGLLVGKGGLYGNVIRVSPPMNIGRTDVDEFIEATGQEPGRRAARATAAGERPMIERNLDRFPDLHPPLDSQSAVAEANRCLFCFDAPCTAACPTHIDVPRFIKKIATGNLRGSAAAILDANILGLSCSRVCPVDVLCEGACVMHRYNKKPIEIGRLQRYAMENARRPPSGRAAPSEDLMLKVACIGGGPASLACAAELRRHGGRVTVFDNRPLPGGLNTYGVAEYKLRPPTA